MAMNRKGFFFTVIALFVVAILLLTISTQRSISGLDRLPAQEVRIQQGEALITLIDEGYAPRIISTIGYSALKTSSLSNTLPTTILDLQSLLKNSLVKAMSSEENPDFGYYLNLLAKSVDEPQDFSLSFAPITSEDITVFQNETTGPWYLGVTLPISYTLSSSQVSWTRENVVITGLIPLTGIADPLHKRKSVIKLIERTATTSWNVAAFNLFVGANQNIHNEKAPSFLGRLTGSFEASPCCGYESIARPNSGVTILTGRSSLDWCALASSPPTRCSSSLLCVSGLVAQSNLTGVRLSTDTYRRFNIPADELSTCS